MAKATETKAPAATSKATNTASNGAHGTAVAKSYPAPNGSEKVGACKNAEIRYITTSPAFLAYGYWDGAIDSAA